MQQIINNFLYAKLGQLVDKSKQILRFNDSNFFKDCVPSEHHKKIMHWVYICGSANIIYDAFKTINKKECIIQILKILFLLLDKHFMEIILKECQYNYLNNFIIVTTMKRDLSLRIIFQTGSRKKVK